MAAASSSASASTASLVELFRYFIHVTRAQQQHIMEGKEALVMLPGEPKSLHEELVDRLIDHGISVDQPIMTILHQMKQPIVNEPLFVQLNREWETYRATMYSANSEFIKGSNTLYPMRFENTMEALTFDTVFADEANPYWRRAPPHERKTLLYPTMVTAKVARVTSSSDLVNRKRKMEIHAATRNVMQRASDHSAGVDAAISAWLTCMETSARLCAIENVYKSRVEPALVRIRTTLRTAHDEVCWPERITSGDSKDFYQHVSKEGTLKDTTNEPEEMARAYVQRGRATILEAVKATSSAADIQAIFTTLRQDLKQKLDDIDRSCYTNTKTGGTRDMIAKSYYSYCKSRLLTTRTAAVVACTRLLPEFKGNELLTQFAASMRTFQDVLFVQAHRYKEELKSHHNKNNESPDTQLALLSIWRTVALEDAIRYQYGLLDVLDGEIISLKSIMATSSNESKRSGGIVGGLMSLLGTSSSNDNTNSSGYESAVSKRLISLLDPSGKIDMPMETINKIRSQLLLDYDGMTRVHQEERKLLLQQSDDGIHDIEVSLASLNKLKRQIEKISKEEQFVLKERMSTALLRWKTKEYAYFQFTNYGTAVIPRMAFMKAHFPDLVSSELFRWCQTSADKIAAIHLDPESSVNIELSQVLQTLAPIVKMFYLSDIFNFT